MISHNRQISRKEEEEGMLSSVLGTLQEVVGWTLAFWFVPVSIFFCRRRGTSAGEEPVEGDERKRCVVTKGHNTPPVRGMAHVLTKVARLRRSPKV
jgi:hypothetical protein